ncbi:metallothionein [Kushneria indalinina]|uniref:Metallothionein n=1 Tax=Kushneria indalinina DSM 14324 TaxID=1122140 RepID=A0A3D9E057_9GAMM|nr:metallothionein [Kushneria indalinina]REC96420.1 metallothionein [Kushneria indalinina DSM 14324]
MSDQTSCACPKCTCAVNDNAVERDGELYCCQACATGHADGSKDCGHNCSCGE